MPEHYMEIQNAERTENLDLDLKLPNQYKWPNILQICHILFSDSASKNRNGHLFSDSASENRTEKLLWSSSKSLAIYSKTDKVL